MKLKPLNSKEKKHFLGLLKEQYGFKGKLDYSFFISEKNRIYMINNEIKDFDYEKLNSNTLGLYIGETNQNEIRLSIDGSQIIGPQCTKNIVEISKDDAWKWMKGEEVDAPKGISTKYVIIKSGNDFLGCGKKKEDRILNYISKTRRLNVSD